MFISEGIYKSKSTDYFVRHSVSALCMSVCPSKVTASPIIPPSPCQKEKVQVGLREDLCTTIDPKTLISNEGILL